jgi:glycosyltransferase involved in cell wall biosynthesis
MVLVGDVDASLLRGHPRVIEMISQHGRVGQTELASILRSADCLILPSRFDSFGMVVPEAMACGLPVIVSDMVGAKELVADGRNGFIVPAENISALVTRMRWMIHNRRFSREMSLEARAAAEQASWACYRRRFVAAVRELLLSR